MVDLDSIANQICGCATHAQRKSNVALLESVFDAGALAMREAALRACESGAVAHPIGASCYNGVQAIDPASLRTTS